MLASSTFLEWLASLVGLGRESSAISLEYFHSLKVALNSFVTNRNMATLYWRHLADSCLQQRYVCLKSETDLFLLRKADYHSWDKQLPCFLNGRERQIAQRKRDEIII